MIRYVCIHHQICVYSSPQVWSPPGHLLGLSRESWFKANDDQPHRVPGRIDSCPASRPDTLTRLNRHEACGTFDWSLVATADVTDDR